MPAKAKHLDCTLKPTFPTNPNGVYLLKGGGPGVWRKFGVPSCRRKSQDLNSRQALWRDRDIGAAARMRWKKQEKGIKREAA